MGAKFLGQLRLVSPSSDCGNFEAHVVGILQSEMAEPADPEDSDKVARFRGCITQRAEGGQARAQQRRCVDG